MDTVTPETRSRMMRSVRGKDTRPEKAVRSCAHRLGLRFRLHRTTLPGRPDLVFPRHRTVILVHGCFWHRHGCRLSTMPSTRVEFWAEKFERNVARDARVRAQLTDAGWRVVEIWECETRDPARLEARIAETFGIATMAGPDAA